MVGTLLVQVMTSRIYLPTTDCADSFTAFFVLIVFETRSIQEEQEGDAFYRERRRCEGLSRGRFTTMFLIFDRLKGFITGDNLGLKRKIVERERGGGDEVFFLEIDWIGFFGSI